MKRKKAEKYLELYKINNIFDYSKSIKIFFFSIYILSCIYLKLPSDIINTYSNYIDSLSLILPSSIFLTSVMFNKKNKIKEFKLQNKNINTKIKQKEITKILEKNKIIKENTPNRGIYPYIIDIESYYTNDYKKYKVKKLVKEKNEFSKR